MEAMMAAMTERLYYKYSDYLKERYGEKVYKLPINLDLTCPNRDGTAGYGGCIFCSDVGTGFESLSNQLSVKEQLDQNKDYIAQKYHAHKFIAYFQNYTNTYMPLARFKQVMYEAVGEDIVEIAVSTRPDCIQDDYLQILADLKQKHGIHITVELGLQTVNYHTLDKIERGHSLAEFIDGVLRIKRYGFQVCTHMILNLPWDEDRDILEGAKILAALDVDQIKLHSLYIARHTPMAKQYLNGDITIISKEAYIKRVVLFLEHTQQQVAIQRLVSRAPEEETLFCNWQTSWWKIRDAIEEHMMENGHYQGRQCGFKNGATLTSKFSC
ncbi:TIGR01212 family radical SAM protein [Vallitalea pronyensis]|nr:TIGR01212 family radical SAM protein [Vallitalea pronyensis]